MKKLSGVLTSLLLLLMMTEKVAHPQTGTQVSATGQVLAEVVPMFTASETAPLNFGRFSPGAQGGKIILTPQGTISLQGSVFKVPGPFNAASFMVTGDANAAYSIKLPSSPVVLTNLSNSKKMVIGNWISNPQEGIGTGMLQDGSQLISVGATLNVGTLQDNPAGIYAGSYNITFEFY
jgi:hypothetical protein